MDAERALILEVSDPAAARAALDVAKDGKPILNGANESNYEEMAKIATEYGVVLGVSAADLDALYDLVQTIEKLGNKELLIDVGAASIRDAFANTVQIRRAALAGGDRGFGYPTIVNVEKLAPGDAHMQTALASLFTLKYGSIVILGGMDYAQALPLFGLRQNIFTDPQKPMTVEKGVYWINGANEDSPCALTVDFALTYFIISGEIERSGVPVNLLIPDAGGYSVLTAWAAGKLSAGSISRFIKEENIEDKIKSRTLMIPGKVAVLKGELEESLPGWKIVVAPNEAISLVKFLKEGAYN
jgi:acetyl-CoA decarbonylase/synthase complex subunit gamma